MNSLEKMRIAASKVNPHLASQVYIQYLDEKITLKEVMRRLKEIANNVYA